MNIINFDVFSIIDQYLYEIDHTQIRQVCKAWRNISMQLRPSLSSVMDINSVLDCKMVKLMAKRGTIFDILSHPHLIFKLKKIICKAVWFNREDFVLSSLLCLNARVDEYNVLYILYEAVCARMINLVRFATEYVINFGLMPKTARKKMWQYIKVAKNPNSTFAELTSAIEKFVDDKMIKYYPYFVNGFDILPWNYFDDDEKSLTVPHDKYRIRVMVKEGRKDILKWLINCEKFLKYIIKYACQYNKIDILEFCGNNNIIMDYACHCHNFDLIDQVASRLKRGEYRAKKANKRSAKYLLRVWPRILSKYTFIAFKDDGRLLKKYKCQDVAIIKELAIRSENLRLLRFMMGRAKNRGLVDTIFKYKKYYLLPEIGLRTSRKIERIKFIDSDSLPFFIKKRKIDIKGGINQAVSRGNIWQLEIFSKHNPGLVVQELALFHLDVLIYLLPKIRQNKVNKNNDINFWRKIISGDIARAGS